jgi:serine/threonine protein kinase
VGRYVIYDVIAQGGMATVRFGRLRGGAGFSKTVAIKTLHPEMARDRDFVAMFLDEVRIAARIDHPNIVSVLDVVFDEPDLFLVMEYVDGEALSKLLGVMREGGEAASPAMASRIMTGVLRGLHAAHEALDEDGTSLEIIHRDVSPHNIMVGRDGVPRILDFGVAKVSGRLQSTKRGYVKGKLGYMAPEQVAGRPLDRRADIYAAAVVFYEALTGVPLRDGDDENVVYAQVVSGHVRKPSELVDGLPEGADELVLKALAKEPEDRHETAAELADEMEAMFGVASPRDVGAWVESLAAEVLQSRSEVRRTVEADSSSAWPAVSSNPSQILDRLPGSQRGEETTSVSTRLSGSHSKATVPTVRSIPARADSGWRRRRMLLAAGATFLVGAVLAGYLLKPDAPLPGTGTASQVPVGVSAAPPTPSDAPPMPSEEPTAIAAPSSSSSVPTAEPSASTVPSPVPRKVAGPRKVKGRVKSKPKSCDPPYVITPEGIRKYKIECL